MRVFGPLEVVALLLGALYTMRKLALARREPSGSPQVAPEAFTRWKAQSLAAINLGVWACFLKLMLSYLVFTLFPREHVGAFRAAGAFVDLAWVAALVVVMVRSHSARKLAERLRIDLSSEQ